MLYHSTLEETEPYCFIAQKIGLGLVEPKKNLENKITIFETLNTSVTLLIIFITNLYYPKDQTTKSFSSSFLHDNRYSNLKCFIYAYMPWACGSSVKFRKQDNHLLKFLYQYHIVCHLYHKLLLSKQIRIQMFPLSFFFLYRYSHLKHFIINALNHKVN